MKNAAVLDVGTGAGILAIAAAKALHRPVLASDIDARAVTIARDNARINGVAARIELVRAAGVGFHRFVERAPFSLIFANILLEPLKVMATSLTKLLAPNGRVVLSGLLNSQASAALASYRARGLALEERIAIGGWTTLVLRRVLDRPSAPSLGGDLASGKVSLILINDAAAQPTLVVGGSVQGAQATGDSRTIV